METALVLRPIPAETRPLVMRLWQLYRHNLSEIRGPHGPEGFRGTLPNEQGEFAVRNLIPYFEEDADRAAYVFYSDACPVGFALILGLSSGPRMMAEFFVVRGARGRGVGRAAVREIFARHQGEWEIPFQEATVVAARFWRHVAATVAGPALREELQPVPHKPDVPPDVWITIPVGQPARSAWVRAELKQGVRAELLGPHRTSPSSSRYWSIVNRPLEHR
jgi:predicted acetyltransferase